MTISCWIRSASFPVHLHHWSGFKPRTTKGEKIVRVEVLLVNNAKQLWCCMNECLLVVSSSWSYKSSYTYVVLKGKDDDTMILCSLRYKFQYYDNLKRYYFWWSDCNQLWPLLSFGCEPASEWFWYRVRSQLMLFLTTVPLALCQIFLLAFGSFDWILRWQCRRLS